jgi:hypothetical protein
MNKSSVEKSIYLQIIILKILVEEKLNDFEMTLLINDVIDLQHNQTEFHNLYLSRPALIHLYDKWLIWSNEKK